MKNIDIIVMGKTGAGKSTLINAALEEDLAPTGTGQAITKKNELYSKKMLLPIGDSSSGEYGLVGCRLNMYDTVGLEIDSSITVETLNEIKNHIEETKQKMNSDDIHLVWFCVNNRSSRFESYELDLIRKLSSEYEIPFIIVLTQCFSDEEGELESQIRNDLAEISRCRVLAKAYSFRGGKKIEAYGITGLIQKSFWDYKDLKVSIIEKKLDEIEKKLDELDERIKEKLKKIEAEANDIISKHVSSASKIGFIPGGCIPFIYSISVKLVADLNGLAGFKSGHDFATEIVSNVIVGIIAMPLMVVPVLSAAAASSYVQTIGNQYLKAMLSVIQLSSDKELEDNALVKQRLKNELSKLKN